MRRLIIILAFFSCSLSSFPQLFNGGIFGGLVASQIDGDYLGGYHKLGFCGGTFIQTRLPGSFGAQLELRYTQKGAASYSETPSIHSLSLHYVEIPVLAQAYLTDHITTEIGLSFGYLMHTNARDGGGNLTPLSDYKKHDYNFLFGVHYAFLERFSLNFRYAYSLSPIREYNTGRYRGLIPDLLNLKDGEYNNLLSLSVYYLLAN